MATESAYKLDPTCLELFLRGQLTLEQAEQRLTLANRALIACAIAVALPERYLRSNKTVNGGIGQFFSDVFGHSNARNMATCGRRAGLYTNLSNNNRRGAMKITLPKEAQALVEQYKDLPNGGIAQFSQQKARIDEQLPETYEVALSVIERLRRTYSQEVLLLIKNGL